MHQIKISWNQSIKTSVNQTCNIKTPRRIRAAAGCCGGGLLVSGPAGVEREIKGRCCCERDALSLLSSLVIERIGGKGVRDGWCDDEGRYSGLGNAAETAARASRQCKCSGNGGGFPWKQPRGASASWWRRITHGTHDREPCMAWHGRRPPRCLAGLLFRSHTTETESDNHDKLDGAVLFALIYASSTTSFSSLHGCFLPEKTNSGDSHISYDDLQHGITQASTYTQHTFARAARQI